MKKSYLNTIIKNITDIQHSLPSGVLLVAAAKTRLPDEVQAALSAGIKAIGYNYVQEAERIHEIIKNPVQWHMIGHLQRNKVKKAQLPHVEMRYLSMGMSNSYKIAIEVGANIVRIGTILFGERNS